MTEKEIKSLFRSIRAMRNIVNTHQRQIRELTALAQSISSPQISGMPHAPGVHDKLGETVARIDELERKLNDIVVAYTDKLHTAYELIELADDIDGKNIIALHWINGMPWDFIPSEINTDRRTMFRHYHRAISEIVSKTNIDTE